MKYIIIESLSAYNYGKRKFKKNQLIWITTSPKVCQFFLENNISFINIEKLINNKDLEAISEISVKIAELSVKSFDELFSEKIYYSTRFLLGEKILRNVHTLIYKNYLLNKLLSITKSKNVICIGDPDKEKIRNDLSFDYNENYNLFSIIIDNCKSKIKIIKYKEKREIINKYNNFFFKKIVSILNVNFAQFLFKLYSKDFLPNFSKKNKNLLIINETDHITKSFLKLKKSFNIKFFKEKFITLNKEILLNYNLKTNLELKYKIKLNQIVNKCIFIFKNSKIQKEQITDYKVLIYLALYPFLKFKNAVRKNLDKIEDEFNQIIFNLEKKTLILSNNSLNFLTSLFVLICKSKNIKLVFCEHGLRGISNWDRFFQKFYQMYKADYGVYYWKNSMDLLKSSPKQKKIISGFPNFQKKYKFIHFIKRNFIKIALKIPINKSVIILLSDLEKNNSTYPGFTNDYEIINNNKKIIKYLAKKNPKKIVILKLYPVKKYIDLYNYEDVVLEFNNVKVVRDISFHYLKDLADEIYLWQASATLLDCVLGYYKKVYFIKLRGVKTFINDFIKKKIYRKTNFNSEWFLLKKNYKKISFNWIKNIN